MADPVQQAGGGEQITVSAVDAPPTTAPVATTIPEQKPPTAEPQKSESQKAEPPKVETQKAEPPKLETQKAEPPKLEPQATEPPKAEPQAAEPPKAETPKAEPQAAEPPKAEISKTEPPKAETPKAEVPKPELPKVDLQTADIPTAESQTEQSPTAPPPTAEPSTAEQVKKVETIEQANVNTIETVSKIIELLATQCTKDINGQENKEITEDVIAPESKQNIELEQIEKTEKMKNPVDITAAPECSEKDEKSNITPSESEGWQKRESELLKKIEELEKVKNARSEDSFRLELKIREEEIDLLKARVKNLETELQAALSKPGGKNHEMIENIKQQHEELLSKARGMIFDKTKMVKNQELQIQALTTQVQSLKDINVITKDLLEIRNSEVKAMEERFQAMEARFKAEKERYDLVLKRAQTSTNINDDLRKEYETQLAIFKELREKYELRVQALVAENNRLKEAVKGPGTSG